MTNIHPFPNTGPKLSCRDAASKRFAHVYDTGDGTFRLRHGIGETAGTMYEGLKEADAQELMGMWVSDATVDEMDAEAYRMGVI